MNNSNPFAAYVGLDWEEAEHSVCVLPAAGGAAQKSEVKHDPEGIAAWVADLRQQFGGQHVAVCVEQSRGGLIYALMQYDFLVLHPINPKQLSDYRKALYPSGSKNDPNDAELLAHFLRDHRDKLRAWHPDDPVSRGLRFITEQRRKWVEQRVALTNELQQRLKESYVLALDFCGENLWNEPFLALLERFPSQQELQRASPKQLEKWLPKKRRKVDDPPAEQLLHEQIAALRKAKPIATDRAVLEHARLAVVNLVPMIRAMSRAIADAEAKIAELFREHPDAAIFGSFPGAGNALAPRLAAAYGTNRDKYHGADDIQQLSGIAPITKSSGKTKVVQMRWACPKFLRQTFHEFAQASTRFSRWAKAYLVMRRAAGHRYHEIIRGLAFKWQRILTHCWKHHKPYDELHYLERLRRTGSKLLAFLPPEPLVRHLNNENNT
jgi:transposase